MPTRAELNETAAGLGIAAPDKLPDKAAVEEAIAEGSPTPMNLSVAAAVEQDLRALAKRDPKLAESGRAAAALSLARDLDSSKNSATSKSMCSKALNELLDRLFELAPEETKEDEVARIQAERASRRAAT